MPYKDLETRKKKQAEWYQKNKQKVDTAARKLKNKRKEFVRRYKSLPSVKCKCGESRWQCLHFHHRNPEEKFKGISELCRGGFPVETIKKEIKKCDVICANCHMVEHDGNIWKESSSK